MERCKICDRTDCSRHLRCDCGPQYVCKLQTECDDHRVDWRIRCLAAESRAEQLDAEVRRLRMVPNHGVCEEERLAEVARAAEAESRADDWRRVADDRAGEIVRLMYRLERTEALLRDAHKGLNAGVNAAFSLVAWIESGDDAGQAWGWRAVEKQLRDAAARIDTHLSETE